MTRLIDADKLREKLIIDYEVRETYFGEILLKEIDNAPTVEYPFYQEAYQTGYEEGLNAIPQGELVEFADFVARNVVDEDFDEEIGFYAEVLCRKLVKLGLVKLDGDTYKYCGAYMRGGAEE